MRRGLHRRQGEVEAQVDAHAQDAGQEHKDQDARLRYDGTLGIRQRQGRGGAYVLRTRDGGGQDRFGDAYGSHRAVRGRGFDGVHRRAEFIQRTFRNGLRAQGVPPRGVAVRVRGRRDGLHQQHRGLLEPLPPYDYGLLPRRERRAPPVLHRRGVLPMEHTENGRIGAVRPYVRFRNRARQA